MKYQISFVSLIVLFGSATLSQAAIVCKNNNKAGAMFIRDTCKKNQSQVNLSDFGAVGPQGPMGPAGPIGAQGPVGPRGPSDGYAFSSGSNILSFVTNTEQNVATLNLPAGNWLITAKLVVNNNQSASRQYSCRLLLGGNEIDNLHDQLQYDIGPNTDTDRAIVTLTGGGTLPAPGTADVICTTNSTSGNWLARSITATQVENLDVQTIPAP